MRINKQVIFVRTRPACASAKWIARLRRLRTDDNLIAFRTDLDAGHAGAAGRFDRLKEVALTYAFAIEVAGAAR